MSEDGYVVAVKRSARKASSGAGRWVRGNGTRRRFDSKAGAREWARQLSSPERTVWVQDAAPWDDSPVDGYVVAGRRVPPGGDVAPGEQSSLGGGEERPL